MTEPSDVSERIRPLVSVYMTVRNGLPFIAAAVDSIKKQTYVNWEAIIVDDGSSDGTASWLQQLSVVDRRFKVIITEGVGRAKALNLALENAKGAWVANLDADDLFHPSKLQCQVDCIGLYPEVEILCSRSIEFYDNCSFDEVPHKGERPVDISQKMQTQNRVGHSSVLMLRRVVMAVGGYDENRKMQLDLDLWYRLLLAGCRIYRQEVSLRAKRVHERQSYENKNRRAYIVSSYKLRASYLNRINAGTRVKIYSFGVFICGFIPPSLRQVVRKMRSSL